MRRLLLLVALALAGLAPAQAQDFPALTGRVVDQAELLSPEQEAALTAKLAALERATTRQLVVATIASLQDRGIEEYGVALGRYWKIGQAEANNGAILIVAPNEKRVRIEIGYGLEGVLTDGLAGSFIRNRITPRFKANDFAGGIEAGVDAIIEQLQAPPELAEQRILAAQREETERRQRGSGGGGWPAMLVGLVILFIVGSAIVGRLRGGKGRRYRRRGGFGWTDILLWNAVLNAGRGGSGGGSWGGGGGFGGFSGGGGSFGGGGASGSW